MSKEKIKQIFNVDGKLIREVEMTEEEAQQFDSVIEIDTSDLKTLQERSQFANSKG